MQQLLVDYRAAAVEHGEATYDSTSAVRTNNAYTKLNGVFLELVAAGRDAELFSLYTDPDPWVQICAAAHTLEIDEDKALSKLRELQKTRYGHTSTTAKYTILEWENGSLSFRK